MRTKHFRFTLNATLGLACFAAYAHRLTAFHWATKPSEIPILDAQAARRRAAVRRSTGTSVQDRGDPPYSGIPMRLLACAFFLLCSTPTLAYTPRAYGVCNDI